MKYSKNIIFALDGPLHGLWCAPRTMRDFIECTLGQNMEAQMEGSLYETLDRSWCARRIVEGFMVDTHEKSTKAASIWTKVTSKVPCMIYGVHHRLWRVPKGDPCPNTQETSRRSWNHPQWSIHAAHHDKWCTLRGVVGFLVSTPSQKLLESIFKQH